MTPYRGFLIVPSSFNTVVILIFWIHLKVDSSETGYTMEIIET
jgi:hypothetical protein